MMRALGAEFKKQPESVDVSKLTVYDLSDPKVPFANVSTELVEAQARFVNALEKAGATGIF